jgi:hypothetical protein
MRLYNNGITRSMGYNSICWITPWPRAFLLYRHIDGSSTTAVSGRRKARERATRLVRGSKTDTTGVGANSPPRPGHQPCRVRNRNHSSQPTELPRRLTLRPTTGVKAMLTVPPWSVTSLSKETHSHSKDASVSLSRRSLDANLYLCISQANGHPDCCGIAERNLKELGRLLSVAKLRASHLR